MTNRPTSPARRDAPASATPSVLTRVLAFASVLLGGVCGGLIGWSLVDINYPGRDVLIGLGALVGAVAGAAGVAVVAVLVLRAMNEWQTIQQGGRPPRR